MLSTRVPRYVVTLRKAEKDLSEGALVAAAKSGGPTYYGPGAEGRFMHVICRVDTDHR